MSLHSKRAEEKRSDYDTHVTMSTSTLPTGSTSINLEESIAAPKHAHDFVVPDQSHRTMTRDEIMTHAASGTVFTETVGTTAGKTVARQTSLHVEVSDPVNPSEVDRQNLLEVFDYPEHLASKDDHGETVYLTTTSSAGRERHAQSVSNEGAKEGEEEGDEGDENDEGEEGADGNKDDASLRREGVLTATHDDIVDAGLTGLSNADYKYPSVSGGGAFDFTCYKCKQGKDKCQVVGFGIQTVYEVYETRRKGFLEANPSAGNEGAKREGMQQVLAMGNLLTKGGDRIEECVSRRITCRNPACQLAAGTITVEQWTKFSESESDLEHYKYGVERHGCDKLFMNNMQTIRELFCDYECDEDTVDALIADTAEWSYCVEFKERQFIGTAIVYAEHAINIGYPLADCNKQDFLDRMKRVPYRLIVEQIGAHVKDRSFPQNIHAKKNGRRGWLSFLKALMEQKMPTPHDAAVAMMFYRNWVKEGRPMATALQPVHRVTKDTDNLGVWRGAVPYEFAVKDFMELAHHQKVQLHHDFQTRAMMGNASDQRRAAAGAGFRGWMVSVIDRQVNGRGQRKTMTDALVFKALNGEHSYAPSDNKCYYQENAEADARYLRVARALGLDELEDQVGFCQNIMLPLLLVRTNEGIKGGGNGATLRLPEFTEPAACVVPTRRCKVRHAKATCATPIRSFPIGAGGRARREATLNNESLRGRTSMAGFVVHAPSREILATLPGVSTYLANVVIANDGRLTPILRELLLFGENSTLIMGDYESVHRGFVDFTFSNVAYFDFDFDFESVELYEMATQLSSAHNVLNALLEQYGSQRVMLQSADDPNRLARIDNALRTMEKAFSWSKDDVHVVFGKTKLCLHYSDDLRGMLIRWREAMHERNAAMPDVVARAVVRTQPAWDRASTRAVDGTPGSVLDARDDAAMAHVHDNYERLKERVHSTDHMSLDEYTKAGACRWFQLQKQKRQEKKIEWFQMAITEGSAWFCASCKHTYAAGMPAHEDTCAHGRSFKDFLKKRRLEDDDDADASAFTRFPTDATARIQFAHPLRLAESVALRTLEGKVRDASNGTPQKTKARKTLNKFKVESAKRQKWISEFENGGELFHEAKMLDRGYKNTLRRVSTTPGKQRLLSKAFIESRDDDDAQFNTGTRNEAETTVARNAMTDDERIALDQQNEKDRQERIVASMSATTTQDRGGQDNEDHAVDPCVTDTVAGVNKQELVTPAMMKDGLIPINSDFTGKNKRKSNADGSTNDPMHKNVQQQNKRDTKLDNRIAAMKAAANRKNATPSASRVEKHDDSDDDDM